MLQVWLVRAKSILSVGVLCILLTAPLGAWGIPRLVESLVASGARERVKAELARQKSGTVFENIDGHSHMKDSSDVLTIMCRGTWGPDAEEGTCDVLKSVKSL